MSFKLSKDANGNVVPLFLPGVAIQSDYNASISSEVEVALDTDTSIIEVSALTKAVLLKYKTSAGGTAVSTSNYDELILAGQTRHYRIREADAFTHVAVIELVSAAAMSIIQK